jgi:hypothetical protein
MVEGLFKTLTSSSWLDEGAKALAEKKANEAKEAEVKASTSVETIEVNTDTATTKKNKPATAAA